MATLHGMSAKKSAVLLRTEEDGTEVWRYRGQIYRVSKSDNTDPVGHYGPYASRKEFYAGHRNWRDTVWFAEAVRERRLRIGSMYRCVYPGPQSVKR